MSHGSHDMDFQMFEDFACWDFQEHLTLMDFQLYEYSALRDFLRFGLEEKGVKDCYEMDFHVMGFHEMGFHVIGFDAEVKRSA